MSVDTVTRFKQTRRIRGQIARTGGRGAHRFQPCGLRNGQSSRKWIMAPRLFLMVYLIGIASLASGAGSDRTSFAFPAARLTMSSAHWEGSSSTEVSTAPHFRGGVTKELGMPRDQIQLQIELISWQFVGRSDYGDVYVFAFRGPGQEQDIVSVVFNGTTPVVIEKRNVRIEISMPRGA